MMKFKKMLLVIAITAASAGMVMAQNNGGEKNAKQGSEKTFKNKHGKGPKDSAHREMNPEKRAEKMTARMKEKLSLTPTQEVQVKAANLELAHRMKALHEKKQQGEDKEGLKKTGKLVRQEYDAKIKAILTAEQLTKWEAMKKEAKEKHKQKRANKAEKGEKKKDNKG